MILSVPRHSGMRLCRSGNITESAVMQILDSIPFELDAEKLASQAGVGSDDALAAEFSAYLDLARSIGRPKAVFRECFVTEKGEEYPDSSPSWMFAKE